MESAYLTIIDSDRGRQYVQYALNEDSMIIPEGLSVPWEDTLCKRAIDENRFYSDNVSEYWGDSEAATRHQDVCKHSYSLKNREAARYSLRR